MSAPNSNAPGGPAGGAAKIVPETAWNTPQGSLEARRAQCLMLPACAADSDLAVVAQRETCPICHRWGWASYLVRADLTTVAYRAVADPKCPDAECGEHVRGVCEPMLEMVACRPWGST